MTSSGTVRTVPYDERLSQVSTGHPSDSHARTPRPFLHPSHPTTNGPDRTPSLVGGSSLDEWVEPEVVEVGETVETVKRRQLCWTPLPPSTPVPVPRIRRGVLGSQRPPTLPPFAVYGLLGLGAPWNPNPSRYPSVTQVPLEWDTQGKP